MKTEQTKQFWEELYGSFDAATPLSFGLCEASSTRDWEIKISSTNSPDAVLASWALLLSRFSGEHRITLGFQGTQDSCPRPLRLDIEEQLSVGDFLQSIKEQRESQVISETNLREIIGIEPGQALFNGVVEEGGILRGRGTQSDASLSRLAQHIQGVINELAGNGLVVDIPSMAEAELSRVTQDWNPEPTAYPEQSVHQLFERQVTERPEAVALIYNDQEMTYGELNLRANRLAHYLLSIGMQTGQGIGIFLGRGIEQLISTLAILKVGAAYIPLDTEFPEERISQMLDDARPAAILTHAIFADRLAIPSETQIIFIDQIIQELKDAPEINPSVVCSLDSRAYIMYTSGSTGRPKGVEVMHRGIVRLLFGVDYVPLSSDTVVLHMAAVSFDAATFEIWAPLLHGGKCVLCSSRIPTLETTGQLLQEHRVNTFWMTSSLFNLVISEAPQLLRPVKYLLVGGEALSHSHVEQALKELSETQLINGYGPTENTTFSTTHQFERSSFNAANPIPIGRAIGNSSCYILDHRRRPVPVGVPGELYVGGDGLARGYINRPDLTKERFLPDPFSQKPAARMYKTGDMAYWNSEGLIEFIGRVDHQIKLRGFRIELLDIDSTLGLFPGVEQAVTVVYEDNIRGKWLAGFVKVANPQDFSVEDLDRFARGKLPEYMVPTVLVPVENWSYTPSGKLDRTALPKPNLNLPSQKAFSPPETKTQEVLVELWKATLELPDIGIEDDFFELGGDSLGGVHLFHKISKCFGCDLPLSVLTQHSTIRSLSVVIDDRASQDDPLAEFRCLQLIQPGDPEIVPLFMMHGGAGNVVVFREFAKNLGSQQPVYAFQWSGWDGNPGEHSITKMAESYKDELLRFMHSDRYRIGGHCIGGLIALELARLLNADGIQIEGPIVISDCPNLLSAKYWKSEPENTEQSKKLFFQQAENLERNMEGEGRWTSPSLPAVSSGLIAVMKRSPKVINLIRSFRKLPLQMKLMLMLVRGQKIPIEDRPGYAQLKLVSAAKKHRPVISLNDVLYFRSECVQGSKIGLQGWWDDPFMGFGELCSGNFEGHVVGGGHNEVLDNPQVARVWNKKFDVL